MKCAVLFLCLVCLSTGCGKSKGDFVQSPQASASNFKVQLLRADYRPEAGGIHLEWFASGQGEVSEFRILKRFQTGDFFHIGTFTGQVSQLLDRVLSFQDADVFAGESQYYKVELEGKAGAKVLSDIMMVRLPGARINSLSAREDQAQIQISWSRENNALAYELVRVVGDGVSEVVFLTQDMTSFTDQNLIGNTAYTYRVNSLMPNGNWLKSLAFTTGFYQRLLVSSLSPPQGSVIRLSLDWAKQNSPMALVFGGQTIGLALFEAQYIIEPFFAVAPDLRYDAIYKLNTLGFASLPESMKTLDLASLSFDGPSIQQHTPRVFVAGIVNQHVAIHAFEQTPDQRLIQIEQTPVLLERGAGDLRTAISHGAQGRLFVCASGRLRMYGPSFEAKGDIILPFAQTPFDVLGLANTLWASFPEEGRLLRGTLLFDGAQNLVDIFWEDIVLPDGARPLGLDINGKYQILVLDAGNAQALVYSQEGQMITRIVDIGKKADFVHSSGALQGDLRASHIASEGVYIINAHGILQYFGGSRQAAQAF